MGYTKGYIAVIFVSALILLMTVQVYAEEINKCTALMNYPMDNISIHSSTVIKKKDNLPDYCKIKGTISNRAGFEARLPISNWNSSLFMAGCGGFCGSFTPDKETFSNSINPALRKGYATIITDAGHQGKNYETTWAMDDDVALELFAYKILPIAMASLKMIVKKFYGQEGDKNIFSGCSNGGRLGLIAAQRYPKLFDGILVGGSILDMTGNAGHHGAWLAQQNQDTHGNRILTAEAARILGHEVMRQCDQLDGLKDGVISNPTACKPDLSTLSCSKNKDTECLGEAEIKVIKALYQGAQDVNGKQLFPGIIPGGEHNWSLWITGNDKSPGWGQLAGESYLKLAAHKIDSLDHDSENYNFSSDVAALENSYFPKLLDATNSDLSTFRDSGGKLIYWHGWADSLISPLRSVRYYQDVVKENKNLSATQDFIRLFMVPGHGHCWGMPGKGPDQFDPISALENWIEKDEAPDFLIAHEKNNKDEISRTRPICAYPKVAILSDKKNPDLSRSYLCKNEDTWYKKSKDNNSYIKNVQ